MNSSEIRNLGNRSEWQGKLKVENTNAKKDTKYVLHSTGDADLNGRTYVALPVGTVLTDDVKRKYNIW